MVNIHLAYTAPINPSGTSLILTKPQLWKGLQGKVRRAQDFVPSIESCKVLGEEDNGKVVSRIVTFKEETGVKGQEERCILFEPMKVDFHQKDGTMISNVVSNGPSGKEDDLYMTYVFEWLRPGVEAGSEENKEYAKFMNMAKEAVHKSIDSIRRMVIDGTID